MVDLVVQPVPQGIVRLRGRISGYRCTRDHASFVFTESDQTAMGVIAIAAAAAGLGGQAMGIAAGTSALEEASDYVEFHLDGQPVRGWVWRSPFKEGDEIEVAAEWQQDHYEAFGIARPADRTIALYPHCSRGRLRHFKNAGKWWVIEGIGFWILLAFLVALQGDLEFMLNEEMLVVFGGCWIFFALMTWSLTRQWMPFVRLAERVFKALEWPHPSDIDLVKSSRLQRTDRDPSEFGTFYFRY